MRKLTLYRDDSTVQVVYDDTSSGQHTSALFLPAPQPRKKLLTT